MDWGDLVESVGDNACPVLRGLCTENSVPVFSSD
jgi:hypothetical protein